MILKWAQYYKMNDLNIIFKILKAIIYEDAKSSDMINKYANNAENLAFVTKMSMEFWKIKSI